ncbi:ABC transporter ATP-binding protein [Methanococcus maripaludis]|uniref:Molybdate/tungstate import ATP-binding protein WtpC n=1 Tax=Methanococcus maripaludis TaxID=39152 RepID=A0A7J9PR93_METMI|nr:ABC transporter ATP-binding protein [Methanococcus maripaludis]MBA2864009.1 osmoprotectant transport system ATP-binding protein [Methanococcus maripaludis]MBB6496025.1 osmoprotectant transport system ATP-binding protein [Methanococcus maripaludis]
MGLNFISKKIENIEFSDVSKFYGDFTALSNFNLEINGGELISIVGTSGSGKTTALRMVNRMIEPTKGNVLIDEISVKNYDLLYLRRNIGYVIQQVGLFPHMTVKENISIIPKLEGWDTEKIDFLVNKLLNLVNLNPDDFLNRYPNQLSGGQQQRVGLARALAFEPPILLMDEPFGALDVIIRKQLQEEFIKIKKELNKTIIFVTHDIEEAFKVSDKIAVINEGKLLQYSTPQELIFNPKNEFITKFMGSNEKFRHLDILKVKNLMVDIPEEIICDVKNLDFAEKIKNFEFLIVTTNGEFLGIYKIENLKNNSENPASLITYPKPIFSPEDSLIESLKEMKKYDIPISVVVKKNKPVGLLFKNKVLLEMI